MMMKMKWILLFGLCSVALQVRADEPVVIDMQSVGGQPPAAKTDANTAAPTDTHPDANAVNKEQFIKGGRMSPREKAAIAKAEIADSNKQTGDNFLASNKSKPGVISLPSGVQYKILRAGKGNKPTDDSIVRCRYLGTLVDGSTFDKTEDKKPTVLHVAGFLPGLKEAVKLMPIGSKWEIVIPPQLGYGAQGNRGVGPNAVLIYVFEILGIK